MSRVCNGSKNLTSAKQGRQRASWALWLWLCSHLPRGSSPFSPSSHCCRNRAGDLFKSQPDFEQVLKRCSHPSCSLLLCFQHLQTRINSNLVLRPTHLQPLPACKVHQCTHLIPSSGCRDLQPDSFRLGTPSSCAGTHDGLQDSGVLGKAGNTHLHW